MKPYFLMLDIYSKYLSDPEVASVIDDAALLAKMVRVWAELAEVQASLGVIPEKAAAEIGVKLPGVEWDGDSLSMDTLKNGTVAVGALAQLESLLSDESRDYLHWGATSQDIEDTARVLVVKEVIGLFGGRLESTVSNLKTISKKHQHTPAVARTRNQTAVPVTFGSKAEAWWRPLQRHLDRLDDMKNRVLILQLAGAGGDLGAMEKGPEVAEKLAKKLDLDYIGNWQNQRDGMAEFADWLGLVAASLGKMAADILSMSRDEVGELNESAGAGGTSSAMPHKNNPVLSEAVVALSHYAAQQAAILKTAVIGTGERDGRTLCLEWLALPQLILSAGAVLSHGLTLSGNLQVNESRMLENLKRTQGLVYSEMSVYLLTGYMSRAEAKELVRKAVGVSMKKQISFKEALQELTPELEIDWEKQWNNFKEHR